MFLVLPKERRKADINKKEGRTNDVMDGRGRLKRSYIVFTINFSRVILTENKILLLLHFFLHSNALNFPIIEAHGMFWAGPAGPFFFYWGTGEINSMSYNPRCNAPVLSLFLPAKGRFKKMFLKEGETDLWKSLLLKKNTPIYTDNAWVCYGWTREMKL